MIAGNHSQSITALGKAGLSLWYSEAGGELGLHGQGNTRRTRARASCAPERMSAYTHKDIANGDDVGVALVAAAA